MDTQRTNSSVIYTNKARCRDCYRCVRVCPVKAIRMVQGQAYVMEDRCVQCGACIRECPQKAKVYRNDVERAVQLLGSGVRVAASIAPSFAAVYREWEWRRLPSALRRLGFSYVAETAVGAYEVAHQTAELAQDSARTVVASCCPAAVRYVELYKSDRVGDLAPIFSPMLAHARMLKEQRKADAVIFIGPCVAKKVEAQRPQAQGLVDCALTFTELGEWFERASIDLAQSEESAFDEVPASHHARLFPVAGGQLKSGDLDSDLLAPRTVSACGFEQVEESLKFSGNAGLDVLELLFCQHGCIDGPGVESACNLYERRMRVLDYARQRTGEKPGVSQPVDLKVSFTPQPVPDDSRITELAIQGIYQRTGKLDPQNRLNCGACGYPTCRDKAIAVLRGMAEADMCIPYMRYLAERRTDRIIETSPNGIVILDENLHILSMNPAFRKLFMCSEAVLGRHISYLMDPHAFEQLAAGTVPRVDAVVEHKNYNYVFHQILYALPDDDQFVGIFVDITETRSNKEQLERLRNETVAQARELMDHQLQVAQQVTKFLGENTARGEHLVEKLLQLVDEAPGGQTRKTQ